MKTPILAISFVALCVSSQAPAAISKAAENAQAFLETIAARGTTIAWDENGQRHIVQNWRHRGCTSVYALGEWDYVVDWGVISEALAAPPFWNDADRTAVIKGSIKGMMRDLGFDPKHPSYVTTHDYTTTPFIFDSESLRDRALKAMNTLRTECDTAKGKGF